MGGRGCLQGVGAQAQRCGAGANVGLSTVSRCINLRGVGSALKLSPPDLDAFPEDTLAWLFFPRLTQSSSRR
jgi:hypothetical protein